VYISRYAINPDIMKIIVFLTSAAILSLIKKIKTNLQNPDGTSEKVAIDEHEYSRSDSRVFRAV
jgi:hypothetical protein